MTEVGFEIAAESYDEIRGRGGQWMAVRCTDHIEIITYEYHAPSEVAFLGTASYHFKRSVVENVIDNEWRLP